LDTASQASFDFRPLFYQKKVCRNLQIQPEVSLAHRAKETTRFGKYTYIEYARFADDLMELDDALAAPAPERTAA
jgi:hypothetical protein